MATPRLTKGAAALIEGRVDDVFDALKIRLLGHGSVKDRKLFISVGHTRDHSLPGIFEQAIAEEGGYPATEYLDRLIAITTDYIDAQRLAAKARMKKRVQDLLRDLSNGKIQTEDVRATIEDEFGQVWKEVTNSVRRVVETETQHAQTIGIKEGIDQVNARFGIDDPAVCFITAKDKDVCEECIRLHTFRDTNGTRIPRVWKSSEVASEYHKKGDPTPSWSLLHPHCRCALTTVLPGFGFDDAGRLQWKGEGHDEWARQRGLEERYLDRYGKLRKSTREGHQTYLNLIDRYLQNDSGPWKNLHPDDYLDNKARDASRDYWRQQMNLHVHDNWSDEEQKKYFDAASKGDTNSDWGDWEGMVKKVFPDYAPYSPYDPPHENLVNAVKKAPITINFPDTAIDGLLKEGRFKNLFETGDGGGETDPQVRAMYEENTLQIPRSVPDDQRPIYGALNVHAGKNRKNEHEGPARSYGDLWAELKPHVKGRSTFTHHDSFNIKDTDVYTAKHPEALAWRIGREWPLGALHHRHGTYSDNRWDFGAYHEAQIHGGVYLKDDVKAIHIGPHHFYNLDWGLDGKPRADLDPGERHGQDVHEQAIELGKKYRIPVYGHIQTKKENVGPRPEYRVVTLYHPDHNRTGAAHTNDKVDIRIVDKELKKSTPAGLRIFDLLKPNYQRNVVKMQEEPGFGIGKDPKVLKQYHRAPISINFPSGALYGLLNDGRFQNLYETGIGLGNNNQDVRRHHEHMALGIPHEAGAHERPIYGALHLWHDYDPTYEMEAPGGARQYGDAFVTLKPHVNERATVTPGDSFAAAPHNVFPADTGRAAFLHHMTTYGKDQRAHRDLMNKVQGTETNDSHPYTAGWDYHEAQIHGGVTLRNDVEAMHFTPQSQSRFIKMGIEAGKKYGFPVYQYQRVNWEKPWETPEQEAATGMTSMTDEGRREMKRIVGLAGNKLKKVKLYDPADEVQAPPVEMSKSELIPIPLFKAANWSLKDFERQIGEYGWYPHSNSNHKLYAHPLIPYKLAVKHEHAHGNLTPYWAKKYAKDIGLRLGYTGQDMQPDPSHAYAAHYREMGHLPPDPHAAPKMKTWEPASEHHEVVPIEALTPTKETSQPWKVLKYQAAFAKGAKLHPVSVVKDGDSYLVDRGHHLLQAAKLAGVTHVPVRHLGGELSKAERAEPREITHLKKLTAHLHRLDPKMLSDCHGAAVKVAEAARRTGLNATAVDGQASQAHKGKWVPLDYHAWIRVGPHLFDPKAFALHLPHKDYEENGPLDAFTEYDDYQPYLPHIQKAVAAVGGFRRRP